MKKAEIRQRDILNHLINIGPYAYEEIMSNYGISVRSMKGDIAALNAQGYTIVGVAATKSYELIGQSHKEAVFYDKPDRKKIRKLIILLIIMSAKEGVKADHSGILYIRDKIGTSDDPLDILQEDFEEKDTTRTIESTIEEMLFDGDLHISGGKYVPASATPLQLPLRKEDGARLLSLLISSSKGHVKEDVLKEIAKKLALSLTGVRLSDEDFASSVISTGIAVTSDKTKEIIDLLEKNSYTNNTIKISYQSKKGETIIADINVGIVIYSSDKNKTYILGESEYGKTVIDVDTITSIKKSEGINNIYRNEEYTELAKAMFEISTENPVHVKVEFDDIPSIREKLAVVCRNRQTAYVKKSNGKLLFEDEVSGLPDFAHFLRRFGYGAKVIEPEELREKMIQSAENVLKLYEED